MNYHGTVIAIAFTTDDLSLIRDALSPGRVESWPLEHLQDAVPEQSQALAVLYDTEGPEHWRQALAQFRRRWPMARVVLVSRLADERMWIEALEAGAYDLLMKPLGPMEILWVVRGALTPALDQIRSATPPMGVLASAAPG